VSWLAFALIAPVTFTAGGFLRKYTVERVVPDARALMLWSSVVGAFAGIILWLVGGLNLLTGLDALIALYAGLSSIVGTYLYMRALMDEAASSLQITLQVLPLFVLVLSFVLLRETITPTQLVGFVLILTAAIGISINRTGEAFRLLRAFWLIQGTNLLWASGIIAVRFVSGSASAFTTAAYESWGNALGGLILCLALPAMRKAFNASLGGLEHLGALVLVLGEGVVILSKLLTIQSLRLAPSAALVSVLGSTQVFMGILVGWALTAAAPQIFKEDTSKAGLVQKIILAGVLLPGIWLVS
jgi:drug/metabolite transporter (DMT)-like permease